ncbi:MAG: thioredoxin family protein [Saprospiraceae bacterium]|nr:thioredoxin family protein [Lewinella sp.]
MHPHFRSLLISVLVFVSISDLQSQKIQWVSFEALKDSLRAQPKPVLIFIHTDWCKYCALQDHNTFQDTSLRHQLKETYYCLRLNAESTETISFLNRSYEGENNGYHELAQLLGKTGGQLVFPTTLLLSSHLQLKQRLTGFVSAEDLQVLLE